MIGGSSRVPLIKSSLAERVYPLPIKTNLNGDESVALGCVYYASGTKFARNKLESVYDLPSHASYASFYHPSIDPGEYMQMKDKDYITANNGRVQSIPIDSGKNGYQKERSFTFPVRKNFRVEIGIKNPHNQKTFMIVYMVMNRMILLEYVISDIEQVIASIENHVESNVTLVFQRNAFGIVQLKKAELTSRFMTQEGSEDEIV